MWGKYRIRRKGGLEKRKRSTSDSHLNEMYMALVRIRALEKKIDRMSGERMERLKRDVE